MEALQMDLLGPTVDPRREEERRVTRKEALNLAAAARTRLRHAKGSVSSLRAAKAAVEWAPSARVEVLAYLLLEPEGATDEEIQRDLRMNGSTERPRRVELVELGLVRDSGGTGRTRSGGKATVWEAIPLED